MSCASLSHADKYYPYLFLAVFPLWPQHVPGNVVWNYPWGLVKGIEEGEELSQFLEL